MYQYRQPCSYNEHISNSKDSFHGKDHSKSKHFRFESTTNISHSSKNMFCPYEIQIFQQFLGNMKILRKLWMCFEGIILVKSSKVSQYYFNFKSFFLHAIIYLCNITRQKGQRHSFVLCLKSLNLGIMSKISSKILWKENVKLTMACFICIWKVQFTGVGGHFRWHWTWTSAVKLLIVDSKVRLTEVLLKIPLFSFA